MLDLESYQEAAGLVRPLTVRLQLHGWDLLDITPGEQLVRDVTLASDTALCDIGERFPASFLPSSTSDVELSLLNSHMDLFDANKHDFSLAYHGIQDGDILYVNYEEL